MEYFARKTSLVFFIFQTCYLFFFFPCGPFLTWFFFFPCGPFLKSMLNVLQCCFCSFSWRVELSGFNVPFTISSASFFFFLNTNHLGFSFADLLLMTQKRKGWKPPNWSLLFVLFKFYWNVIALHLCLLCVGFFFRREACGILSPWPGMKHPAPALAGGFSATGLPGKSPVEMLTSSAFYAGYVAMHKITS